MSAYDLMEAQQRLFAVDAGGPRSKCTWRLIKPLPGRQSWTFAGKRKRQLVHSDSWKNPAICRCPDWSSLNHDTVHLRTVAALLLFFGFSVHHFTAAAAAAGYVDKHSQQVKSTATPPFGAGGSWEGSFSFAMGTSPSTKAPRAGHSAADPPLFHIVWPEEPLDLDTMLRNAAEHQKVPWGKKVLAGRLAALTTDEADDFCRRIKFAVEKHLRAVFDASPHFKIFEGMPTAVPFLHLNYVRDYMRSQFSRDKIRLSLPDRELEPLFKHAGGLPWKKNTDATQLQAHMQHYAERGDSPPPVQHSRSWTHEEL